jgi:hypothetical protein
MTQNQPMSINFKGMSDAQKKLTQEIIDEWERDFEDSVVHGKGGYVEMIQTRDYVIAGLINLAIIIYFVIAVQG